jgi:hypothetical protein
MPKEVLVDSLVFTGNLLLWCAGVLVESLGWAGLEVDSMRIG